MSMYPDVRPMSVEELEALHALVSYSASTEREHWEENGQPKDHIYPCIRTLQNYMDMNKIGRYGVSKAARRTINGIIEALKKTWEAPTITTWTNVDQVTGLVTIEFSGGDFVGLRMKITRGGKVRHE